MKACAIVVGLALLGVPSIRAAATEEGQLARVTVYWASGGRGSDHWSRRHQSSTNVRLRTGHCAVDPRRIPYGSKVLLPDATLVAVDTGRHVVSRKAARRGGRTPSERNALVVDRFFETKRQALTWAATHPPFMTVQIRPPNYRPIGSLPYARATVSVPNSRPIAVLSNARAITAAPAARPVVTQKLQASIPSSSSTNTYIADNRSPVAIARAAARKPSRLVSDSSTSSQILGTR
jgi:3D (Asp-Asp-Asp) domain-containing protein